MYILIVYIVDFVHFHLLGVHIMLHIICILSYDINENG